MNQEKKLPNYLIIILKICLELFTKSKQGTGLKILTPKQMFQGLSIALPQIKAGNNSKTLLNEIRQTVYSFYQ